MYIKSSVISNKTSVFAVCWYSLRESGSQNFIFHISELVTLLKKRSIFSCNSQLAEKENSFPVTEDLSALTW